MSFLKEIPQFGLFIVVPSAFSRFLFIYLVLNFFAMFIFNWSENHYQVKNYKYQKWDLKT